MGFVTEEGKVTNAGLLFCDQGYLKQSKVVCTRWKGTEKGSVEGDALDDEEFTGMSLITLLSNAEAFIRTNSKNPWSIRGMRLSIGIIGDILSRRNDQRQPDTGLRFKTCAIYAAK